MWPSVPPPPSLRRGFFCAHSFANRNPPATPFSCSEVARGVPWNSMELSAIVWGWRTLGGDPCRRVQPQRSLKPSLAIACSLRRKPTPRSFVRSYSAWPAIGCGRHWKRTTRRRQLGALCGAGGFSRHAARLERARELVLCGTQIDLLRAGWAIDSRLVHRVRPRLLDGLGCNPQRCADGRDCCGRYRRHLAV
jgi:hypothetical protein